MRYEDCAWCLSGAGVLDEVGRQGWSGVVVLAWRVRRQCLPGGCLSF